VETVTAAGCVDRVIFYIHWRQADGALDRHFHIELNLTTNENKTNDKLRTFCGRKERKKEMKRKFRMKINGFLWKLSGFFPAKSTTHSNSRIHRKKF
jgi:hypothetical protein